MMLTAPTDQLNLDMLDQNAAGVPPSLTGK